MWKAPKGADVLPLENLSNKCGFSSAASKGDVISFVDLEHVFAVLRFVSQQDACELTSGDSGKAPTQESSKGNPTVMVSNRVSSKPVKVSVPLLVEEKLELYRMAVTNVPVNQELVKSTRGELHGALLEAYPAAADEINKLWNRDVMPPSPSPMQPAFLNRTMYQLQFMHEVVNGLFLGSYHPASNKELLQERGVTHILCCISVAPRFPSLFKYMVVRAEDAPNYNIAAHFEKTYAFIESAIADRSSAVLVHCGAGISRAPTIAAAYLMKKMRLPADAVIALIIKKRPVASPNNGFRMQLRKYQDELGIPG